MRKEEAAGGGKAGAHARCGGGGGAKWRGRMRAAGRRGFGAWAHAQWLRRAAPPEGAAAILCVHPPTLSVMALVSADSRIAELLGELHQLIKQTQVSGWGHTLTRKNLGGGGQRFYHPPSPPPAMFLLLTAGGALPQRAQPGQHPENAREDADGE